MGRAIQSAEFTREDRTRYREKVKACLSALATLIEEGRIATGQRMAGVEVEVVLSDANGHAMPVNVELLERIAAPGFQTELAQFQIEFDLRPRELTGDAFDTLEHELRASLDSAHEEAAALDAQVTIIGILPTLTDVDVAEQNLTVNPRYRALNDQILLARGEDIVISIEGDETLEVTTDSIMFEGACTSMQLHLQVDPDAFARYWNAAQALSAPLLAAGANSPFFLGKQLHHETRIALFQQSVDTRTEELATQGVRPRVWFGERWLREGIFELYDENVRYFPALLPECAPEDPQEQLARGAVPHLEELSLHNGTIYRWNRPVYAVAEDRPHIRIENRVLPSGPTVIDAIANATLYYGLLSALANDDRPVWDHMSFEQATENFYRAARLGLGAKLYWPHVGAEVPVCELLLTTLLPLAREGLSAWGVAPGAIDRYLGVMEQRILAEQNGASWQIATYGRLLEGGSERGAALQELMRRYHKRSQAGEPVHTWPVEG